MKVRFNSQLFGLFGLGQAVYLQMRHLGYIAKILCFERGRGNICKTSSNKDKLKNTIRMKKNLNILCLASIKRRL